MVGPTIPYKMYNSKTRVKNGQVSQKKGKRRKKKTPTAQVPGQCFIKSYDLYMELIESNRNRKIDTSL